MMRTLLKVVGVLVAAVLVLLLGAYAYVQFTWQRNYSSTPLPAITASTDPAVIARGEYVANAVAHCSACHLLAGRPPGSPIDWEQGFAGGYVWEIPLFGQFVAANITPDVETGIGGMSDAQLARAIRHAVGRDGRVLPFMLLAIGHMSDEDLTGVVSYLRSRPAVRQVNTPEEWGIMARVLAGSFTPRLTPVPADVAGIWPKALPRAASATRNATTSRSSWSAPRLPATPHPKPTPSTTGTSSCIPT
jgi:mono/diheme cytochrome c family protein